MQASSQEQKRPFFWVRLISSGRLEFTLTWCVTSALVPLHKSVVERWIRLQPRLRLDMDAMYDPDSFGLPPGCRVTACL